MKLIENNKQVNSIMDKEILELMDKLNDDGKYLIVSYMKAVVKHLPKDKTHLQLIK